MCHRISLSPPPCYFDWLIPITKLIRMVWEVKAGRLPCVGTRGSPPPWAGLRHLHCHPEGSWFIPSMYLVWVNDF